MLPSWRFKLLMLTLLAGMLLLAVRAAFLTIDSENNLRSNMWTISRAPESFRRLGEHMNSLEKMTSNIDQYSLSQIQDALQRISILINQANMEFQAQQKSWGKIQIEIKKDRISFLEIQQQLDDAQKIQTAEIIRLKTLLDTAAKPSMLNNVADIFISFLLGIFSSIAATKVYSWGQLRHQSKGAA